MTSETEKSKLNAARVEESDDIARPTHVAGSGILDRLVDTARDYARAVSTGSG